MAIPGNRIAPVTAGAIATINQLAPGRVILGLGTGFTGHNTMGLPPIPLATLREHVQQCCGLLRGEEVLYREGQRQRWLRFLTKAAAPELVENLSANVDLVMESKARWDAGGKAIYGQKVVGTGAFQFVERKVGAYILYKRVDNHWRKTSEYKELEFRWVTGGVTRLATLLAEEVQISDGERALQQDAAAKGMKILSSNLPAIQHQWHFGGLYLASPDKLDPKVPFVDKRVRQAMNRAINRRAIAEHLLGGRVQPQRLHGYHPQLDSAIWPGLWNPDWDRRFDDLYGYNPAKARELLTQAGYPNGVVIHRKG